MDACFHLVRKKSSGKNLFPPRHSSTMFFNQHEVDEFVDIYSSGAQQAKTVCEQTCQLSLVKYQI